MEKVDPLNIKQIEDALESTDAKNAPHTPPSTLAQGHESVCPSGQASFLSRLTISWLTPLVDLAYRRDLSESDLWSLAPEDSVESCVATFRTAWATEQAQSRPELRRALYRAFGSTWRWGGVCQFFFMVCSLLQPIVVRQLLRAVSARDADAEAGGGISDALAWAAALGILTVLSGVLLTRALCAAWTAGCRIRAALMTVVFEHSMAMGSAARRGVSLGKTTNLMSVDTERIFMVMPYLHFLWQAPLTYVGVLAQLWWLVGPSAIAGIALAVAVFVVQRRLGRKIGGHRRGVVRKADARVKLMAELLRYIRVVKLYAWEAPMRRRLEHVRRDETGALRSYLVLKALMREIAFTVPSLVAVLIISLMVWAQGQALTLVDGVTVLAFLAILRFPTNLFSQAMSFSPDARVGLGRIQRFLSLPVVAQLSANGGHGDGDGGGADTSRGKGGDSCGHASVPSCVRNESAEEAEIHLRNASFAWERDAPHDNVVKAEGGTSKNADGGDGAPALGDSGSGSDTSAHRPFVLRDLALDIGPGELVAIIGRVGSGKSSLLAAILGEMELAPPAVAPAAAAATAAAAGTPHPRGVHEAWLHGAVGYVAQQPWIINATLRENILFGLPMRRARYLKCLAAAALLPDLKVLPGGDMCEIGEAGINLSGGQRSRVALCRAFYAYRGGSGSPDAGNADSDVECVRLSEDGVAAGEDGEPTPLQQKLGLAAPRAQIVLLDDPLAAVDHETGLAIFERGLARGSGSLIAPEHGATTVMTMNSHLHLLHRFDRVIVLDEGRIVADGSLEKLKARVARGDNDFPPRVRSLLDVSHVPSVGTADADNPVSGSRESEASSNAEVMTAPTPAPAPAATKSVDATSVAPVAAAAQGRLVRDESRQTGAVRWATYRRYFGAAVGGDAPGDESSGAHSRSRSWRECSVFVFVMLLYGSGQCARVLQDLWVTVWAENGGSGNDSAGKVYLALAACTVSLCIGRAVAFMRLAAMAARNIHQRVLARVVCAPVDKFFDVTPVGEITNRFAKDMDVVDATLPDFMMQLLQNSWHIGSILVLQAVASPWFVAFAVALLSVFYRIRQRFQAAARDTKRLEGTSRTPVYRAFAEVLGGLETIRAFGSATSERFRLQQRQRAGRHCACFFAFQFTGAWLMFRLEFFSTLVVCFTAALAAALRHSSDAVDPALLGIALVYAMQLTALFQRTVKISIETQAYLTSAERCFEYLTLPQERAAVLPTDPPMAAAVGTAAAPKPAPASALSAATGAGPRAPWPSAGAVEFQGVELSYRGGPLVLRGTSFALRAGEKVGVCGRTGAGKSSLIMALFRMCEPCGGRVLIDGVDVGTLGLRTLRSALTIIPQEAVLFQCSVRENLDPFSWHDDAACIEALHRVGLKGVQLEQQVEELGSNFSAGQRQLLCIARALLKAGRVGASSVPAGSASIVCLDEATSAVDAATDALVQRAIREYLSTSTMLVIAHRLRTIMDADRVLVMDNGRVAEYDTPQRLMASTNGIFSRMVHDADDTDECGNSTS